METANYHLQFEEQIEAYLTEGLFGPEKEAFEKHRSICDTCRASLDQAGKFAELVLQAFRPYRSPAGLEDRLVNAFRTQAAQDSLAKSQSRPLWSRLQRWVAVPAAALLLIIIGSLIMTPMSKMHKRASVSTATKVEMKEDRMDLGMASMEVEKVEAMEEMMDTGSGLLSESNKLSESLSKDKSNNEVIGYGYAAGRVGAPGSRASINKGAPLDKKQLLPIGAPLDSDRKIIKSGTLSFEVESFETAYQKVIAILIEEKGYVASTTTDKLPNGKVRGQIIIRIPPDRFDSVTLKLRSLGELKNQQVKSEDVTKQYVDLQSRLKNAKALEERLIKLMSERKGEIKELLEVEKELANTREKVELLQGEIKYYENMTSLATLILDIFEKDITKPVEYVQTQSAELTMAVADVEASYQQAQAIISGLKGQIGEGKLGTQDKKAHGSIRAYVDAENFPALLAQLKALGEPKYFNAAQTQTSSSGAPINAENTPVRKERGLVALTLVPPAGEYIQTKQAEITLEASDVDNLYTKAQALVADAQAKMLSGSINRSTDRISANMACQVEADRFRALVESLKALGKVKNANVDERQQASGIDAKSMLPAPVRKDPGTISLTIITPGAIVSEEHGMGATLKSTLKGSIAGLLWSLEMLIVGFLSLAPWIAAGLVVWLLVKRFRRNKSA